MRYIAMSPAERGSFRLHCDPLHRFLPRALRSGPLLQPCRSVSTHALCHWQPLVLAHCSTSRWPPLAALEQVYSSHSHPFALAHCSTSRWPPAAALEHVYAFHRHPFALAHCSTSRWPPSAALEHVPECHSHPFALAHCSTSRWPPAAALEHVEPWSPQNHHLFPSEARARAVELTLLGAQLSREPRFEKEDDPGSAVALQGVWIACVVPHAVSRG